MSNKSLQLFKVLESSETRPTSSWRTCLNYIGGSCIYVRQEFASHFKVLESSWNTTNNESWHTFLSYASGSYTYVRPESAVVQVLESS